MQTSKAAVHVAVGVIRDQQGNILIARRPKHVHQGGLWEFPGGKVEAGETVAQALRRELREEVGVEVAAAQPLIQVRHDYGDILVQLDVFDIINYSGVVSACEGQALRWVAPYRLREFSFPAANFTIIKAAQLPGYYAILEGNSFAEVLENCRTMLASGVSLLQFRVKSLPVAEVPQALVAVLKMCKQQRVALLLNSDLSLSLSGADGLHLSSRALMNSTERPQTLGWVAASCHNLAELKHAEKLGVDFAVLAPVKPTATHPHAVPLGWEGLTVLLQQVNLPVYALGGLGKKDFQAAIHAGAQGVAGISAFLEAGLHCPA